jgi:hypothetical protein
MFNFRTFSPDHEVRGLNVLNMASAIDSQSFLPLYEKYELADIDADGWYPLQTLLDVLYELSRMPNSIEDLVGIGMKGMETSVMPPGISRMSFSEVMALAPQVYQLNHRGTDVGEISVEQISDYHYREITCVPLPDDVWYGAIYAYVRTFVPEGMGFRIYYEPEQLRRDNGGDVTIYHIELKH